MVFDEVLQRNFKHISPEYLDFARRKDACRDCSLYACYSHVGQSEGNAKNPTFMFIGEALGADEVTQGRPFIGRAGQRLRTEMRRFHEVFNRDTTIITNVLPCRPADNVFPADGRGMYYTGESKQSVKARELVSFCCNKWLFEEIKLLKPKVLVTLGSKSLEMIRGVSGITAQRGSWNFLDKFRTWAFSTYHPSYVLRCQNDEEKEYVVQQFAEDIEKIATTWATIVSSDHRLNMTEDEWRREKALKVGIEKRLYKQEPING